MSVSWLAYGAGALLRFLLASSTSFLEDRPEISTPLNSWKRLTEGVHLSRLGRWPRTGLGEEKRFGGVPYEEGVAKLRG